MREKLEFSESKQCCAEHIKMPLLLCRQGAIDWGALSRPLSSSPPPCALLLFILPLLFPPYYLGCSINIGQYLVSSSVRLDHTSHIFSSNALLSASFQGRTHLPGYLPEALECPRLSDKVLLVEKNLSKGRILLPNRMNF